MIFDSKTMELVVMEMKTIDKTKRKTIEANLEKLITLDLTGAKQHE